MLEKIKQWIPSEHTYICRFGIEMLMRWFLDEDFKPEYLKMPASVRSDEYYVNMMIAWFFATALAKQWDATIPYLQDPVLEPWTHNKTIQKARESFRITPEQKEYLKTLKSRGAKRASNGHKTVIKQSSNSVKILKVGKGRRKHKKGKRSTSMTLQQLTYIKMTAECGNITEAAEKLFISQPSLSAAIHNLEKKKWE